MPPAISDDEMESDGPDSVPAKGKIPTKATEPEEDEEEDDEDDEEEYRVEKILNHGFHDDGSALYQIKWLGYNDASDRTWEPIENLENAMDIVEAYHKKIGGPPNQKSAKKKAPAKNKRSASAAFAKDSPAVEASAKKRGRKSTGDAPSNGTDPKLPEGSWEDHVLRVSSIVEESSPVMGKGQKKDSATLYGLIEWHAGNKTQHPLTALRRKCPQKLLDYYEQHLVFKKEDPVDMTNEIEV